MEEQKSQIQQEAAKAFRQAIINVVHSEFEEILKTNAKWLVCDYNGASINPSLPNKGLPINDTPINLNICESFSKRDITKFEDPDGETYQIIFKFKQNPPIVWNFINNVLRDLEFNRAVELINSN